MGFCHAANEAIGFCPGASSCASIIVNAPWFREAEICLKHSEFDVGVHLTLTAEYPTFRWPPLSTRDPATGLLDKQGYLWHSREDAIRHVTADAGRNAGANRYRSAVSIPIHTHMGSVVHPKSWQFIYLWLKNMACLLFCRVLRVNGLKHWRWAIWRMSSLQS